MCHFVLCVMDVINHKKLQKIYKKFTILLHSGSEIYVIIELLHKIRRLTKMELKTKVKPYLSDNNRKAIL